MKTDHTPSSQQRAADAIDAIQKLKTRSTPILFVIAAESTTGKVLTQQPSGLDPSIQRNADVLLVHALSHRDDIDAAEGMINTSPPTEVAIERREKIQGSRIFEAVVRSLPLGYALASTDRANRLFPIRVRPRVTVHGGTEY